MVRKMSLFALTLTIACSDDQSGSSGTDQTHLLGDAQLAFVVAVDEVDQVWLMRTDGSDRRALTFGGGAKQAPTWSPDGHTLVFVEHPTTDECPRPDALVTVTDAGVTELAQINDVVSLAFDASGDGVYVVTGQCEVDWIGSTGAVHWVSLDGTQNELLVSLEDVPSIAAAPTPGRYALSVGRWYWLAGDDDIHYEFPDIFIGERGVAELDRIVDLYAYDTEVSWHPDGQRLVFQSDFNGEGAVYSVAADGSDMRRETPSELEEFAPRWSPDGQTLLSQRWVGGSEDVTVLRTANDERAIHGIAATAWSPDQSELLVENSERIVVLELASETQRDLGEGRMPTWRPQ